MTGLIATTLRVNHKEHKGHKAVIAFDGRPALPADAQTERTAARKRGECEAALSRGGAIRLWAVFGGPSNSRHSGAFVLSVPFVVSIFGVTCG